MTPRKTPNNEFEYEAENWVSCRIATDTDSVPSIDEAATAESQADLPPNFRWALRDNQVVMSGDLHGTSARSGREMQSRLQRLAARASLDMPMLDELELICQLGQLGCDWELDGSVWRASLHASGGERCDLIATRSDEGVCITTIVATWDVELSRDCRRAAARYLVAANGAIRFARLVLDDREVRAESIAMADRLDVELADCVAGVVGAFVAVRRELRALLDIHVAREYLKRISESGN